MCMTDCKNIYKYQYSRYTPRANTGRLIYPALTCGTGDKRPAEYKCEVKHSKLCVYRLYLYTAARYTEGAREREPWFVVFEPYLTIVRLRVLQWILFTLKR